jgi:hypothetical protein
MNLFKSIFNAIFSGPDINPANGLPMIDGSHIDVAGNPYGSDLSHDTSSYNHDWGSSSHDWGSSSSSFDSSSSFGGGSDW